MAKLWLFRETADETIQKNLAIFVALFTKNTLSSTLNLGILAVYFV